jgi:ABC-2 type transport system permease protein
MRLYYEIAVRSFRRATIYRSAYIAGILTNAFFGALRCFVYSALFAAGGSVAGFTLQQTISYTWITQSLISVGAGWIIGTELIATIRTGDVVTDLMRPWNFYAYWLSRSLGERCFNLLLRGTLTYVIGILYFGAHVPSARELAAFALSISLSLLISFAFSFSINLTAFWLIDNSGIIGIANLILGFFSGFWMPIAFLPAPLQAIVYALPFQAITSLPAQVFLGQIQGAELGATLLLQVIWAIVLTMIGLLILQAAAQKVVTQGG